MKKLLFVICIGLILVSCGKEDNSNNIASNIVGKWRVTRVYSDIQTSDRELTQSIIKSYEESLIRTKDDYIIFRKKGEYIYFSSYLEMEFEGSYSIKNYNTLTICHRTTEECEDDKFIFTDNILTLGSDLTTSYQSQNPKINVGRVIIYSEYTRVP